MLDRKRSSEGWITPPETGLIYKARSANAERKRAALGFDSKSLAGRMDEAAALLHSICLVRSALVPLAGSVALLTMTFPLCCSWIVGGLAVEAWSWLATRAQATGRPYGWRTRFGFAANYAVLNAWWLLLGALFWRTGTPEGMACGAIIFLCIGSIVALLFHTAPVMFVAAGAAPAIGALAITLFADGRGWRQQLPVWLMLGVTGLFSIGRALGTPSAQKQQRWLADSLKSYEALAENITDVITRVDPNGVCQYVSPAAFSSLGYRPDELVGTPLGRLLHPRSATEMAATLSSMLADETHSREVTSRVRHRDGRWLWLQTTLRVIRENGQSLGVIGVSRDVTARVAADKALRDAKAEAEAANSAKAEFLANVSHEIRTPMNGILGAIHLLEGENISPEGRSLMRQADDCGRMLSQLLNDVLDFSKIEAGQLDLAPEPMHLGEALQAVTSLLKAQADAKGVDLRCELEGEDPWVEADPVRVRQVMFNLLGNAVKFTEVGRVTARLRVRPEANGRRAISLEVTDTGIGMTPETQRQLFQRFRQGEGGAARRYGGTGLGLSNTRALVKRMGGEIGVTSAAGEGSTFWIELDAPATCPVATRAGSDIPLSGVNILLVDDNAANRVVARTMLARLGAQVEEAEDGLAGVEAARRGAHDLILMDIQMPRMDGMSATRAIRGLQSEASRAPILGLTANAMTHQRVEYLAAGMNGVVAKPISPAALLGEISRVMAATEPQAIAG